MKKVVVILIAVLPLLGSSQSFFDKYEDMDNVGSVIINKGLIDLVAALDIEEDDPEVRDFMEVARGIDGIKVFMTEDESISEDMRATVGKYLKSSSLEELMRVKDKDTHVKFYVRNGRNENHVKELLMFVSGIQDRNLNIDGRRFESVLVTLTGDIQLDKIGALTKKMNLPKELNEAGRGKH